MQHMQYDATLLHRGNTPHTQAIEEWRAQRRAAAQRRVSQSSVGTAASTSTTKDPTEQQRRYVFGTSTAHNSQS